MTRWWLLLGCVSAFALGGCRCDDGTLTELRGGFQTDQRVVDFGRSLEGTAVTRELEVFSTGRATVDLRVTVEGPFRASAPALTIPGGSRAVLTLSFLAGATRETGLLHLASAYAEVTVELVGVGVAPKECFPTAPCRVSTFEVATASCVETLAADGTSCVPENQCLENGECHAGICQGSPRSCNDGNVCTTDACSPVFGCVHSRRRCDPPTEPCQVATCHPVLGCGKAPAPDGTPCGEIDCTTAHVCLRGACAAIPTPDGTPCAPPTPCQGEGTCQAQECVRPDAGEIAPTYSLPLAAGPAGSVEEPGFYAHDGNLFLETCAADGGCALASWTGTGFERFTSPHDDARSRRVLTVSDGGVWVQAEDALELYEAGSGALQSRMPLASIPGVVPELAPERIALRSSGELWASFGRQDAGEDAGEPAQVLVRFAADGGAFEAREVPGLEGPGVLALDERDRLYVLGADGGVARGEWNADGGFDLAPWADVSGVARSIAIGHGRLVLGAERVMETDGGTELGRLRWIGDAGQPLYPLPSSMLVDRDFGFAFYRVCAPPRVEPCSDVEKSTWVRAFDMADAGTAWEAELLPPELPGAVAAAVMAVDGGFGALTQVAQDGGFQAYLDAFIGGDRVLHCPLQAGAYVGAALFDRTFLYAVVSRDAGWNLEAYDLGPVPLDYSGWAGPNGLSGTRRAQ